MVGSMIGSKLIGLGHSVMMGWPAATNEKVLARKKRYIKVRPLTCVSGRTSIGGNYRIHPATPSFLIRFIRVSIMAREFQSAREILTVLDEYPNTRTTLGIYQPYLHLRSTLHILEVRSSKPNGSMRSLMHLILTRNS